METQTMAPVIAPAPSGLVNRLAYLGAGALAVAAAWNALAARGVTVASAPRVAAGVPADRALRINYRWLVTTLPQERLYTVIAIIGFVTLAAVAGIAKGALGGDRLLARAGALCVGIGAAAWVTGAIAVLGGHQAVGLMATHRNPIEVTNSISFTTDMVHQAFELAAFAFIGAGLVAFGWQAIGLGRRGWAGCTLLLAVLSLVTAWSYAAGNGDVSDLLLLIVGVAVTPVWLVWTARLATARLATASPS